MNIIRRRGWEIPESCATPEHLFFDRRAFLAATGAGLACAPCRRSRWRSASPIFPIRAPGFIRSSATRNTCSIAT